MVGLHKGRPLSRGHFYDEGTILVDAASIRVGGPKGDAEDTQADIKETLLKLNWEICLFDLSSNR